MRRHTLTGTTLLALLAGGTLAAAQQDYTETPRRDAPAGMQPGATAGATLQGERLPVTLVPLEWVMNANVVGPTGEDIGRVNDMIIDAGKGKVKHAIVSYGGIAGIGAERVVVPWLALKWDADKRTVTTSLAAEQLKAGPKFDDKDWDRAGEKEWNDGIFRHYGVEERDYDRGWGHAGRPADMDEGITDIDADIDVDVDLGDDDRDHDRLADLDDRDAGDLFDDRPAATVTGLVRASKVLDENLEAADGENIGEVDEMIFDADSGRIAFLVVNFGGFLGIGQDQTLLPWDVVKVTRDGEWTTAELDRASLENAPKIDDLESQIRDRQIVVESYRHFGKDASWLETGFSRRDALATIEPRLDIDMDEDESEYGRAFRSGRTTELSGTISDVKTAEPVEGMKKEVTAITVRSDMGERTIHLCPHDFLGEQGLTLSEGDRITVKGRQAMVGGRDILIATEITTPDGRTVTIRQEDGKPAWKKK